MFVRQLLCDRGFEQRKVSGKMSAKTVAGDRIPVNTRVVEQCSETACPEAAIVLLGDSSMCSKHFIERSYQELEKISERVSEPAFDESLAETAGRLLEDCMRGAADIAGRPTSLSNLEKARVVDVLLWASELYGRLRRSPRVATRIPVLLRSEAPDRPWEEKTETQLVSRHGMQVSCRRELRKGETLTCVRLDSGRRAVARVAWTRSKDSGEIEAGLEFANEDNFWGLAWNDRPAMRRA